MVSVKVPIGHLCVHAIFFPCFCLDSGFSLYYDLAKWPQVYNQGFKPTKPTGLRFTTMGWTPILTCGCVSPKTHIPSWEDSSFVNWIQTIHWQCWMWQTPIIYGARILVKSSHQPSTHQVASPPWCQLSHSKYNPIDNLLFGLHLHKFAFELHTSIIQPEGILLIKRTQST